MNQAERLRKPSRKRRLLAVHIDYLVFTAVYQPIAWALGSVVPAASKWSVAIAVFAVLRFLGAALRIGSPGDWSLGIGAAPGMTLEPRIARREKWWTMAAGTLLVLEGSKNAVRWTQALPIEPLFGAEIPAQIAIVGVTVLGAANIAAGLLILRTHLCGAVLGVSVLCAELLAAVVNRQAFRRWAADAVVARRALQGIPVRDGEIEMMQTLTVNLLPLAMLIGVISLVLTAVRFKRSAATPVA